MKHTLFILALITATIQTFAQSPRIKLNQITKDSLTGSVLISSPTDSGMVYSRDLFISYEADTFLILGGDTIVLQSDLIAEIGDSLLNYVPKTELSDSLTNYASKTELSDSTSNIRTDIPLIITDSLLNYVNISGTQTITGAKTFSSIVTGTSNLRAPKIQVGTSATINDVTGVNNTLQLSNYTPTAFITGSADNYIYKNASIFGGLNAHTLIFQTRSDVTGGGFAFVSGSTPSAVFTISSAGNVGIGDLSPGYPLEMGSGAHVTAGGVWTNASDIKLKTNINYIYPYGLSEVLNLKPVVFDYINGEKNSLGFIAQDVYEIIPEAISSTLDKYGNETMGLKMVSITATLTKAIQEQQSIIETQATEIEQLKTLIIELSNRLTILENN